MGGACTGHDADGHQQQFATKETLLGLNLGTTHELCDFGQVARPL